MFGKGIRPESDAEKRKQEMGSLRVALFFVASKTMLVYTLEHQSL